VSAPNTRASRLSAITVTTLTYRKEGSKFFRASARTQTSSRHIKKYYWRQKSWQPKT
jgi:hypothetical protein